MVAWRLDEAPSGQKHQCWKPLRAGATQESYAPDHAFCWFCWCNVIGLPFSQHPEFRTITSLVRRIVAYYLSLTRPRHHRFRLSVSSRRVRV